MNILGLHNKHGVTMNETAVCEVCLFREDLNGLFVNWETAEDKGEEYPTEFHPADNPDACCQICGIEQ